MIESSSSAASIPAGIRAARRQQKERSIKKERRAYRISGQVQGVGYRYYARHEAKDLDLTGWVCNRGDGTVEVHVEGPGPQLAAFEDRLKTGPPSGYVERLERIAEENREGYQDFEIRFG